MIIWTNPASDRRNCILGKKGNAYLATNFIKYVKAQPIPRVSNCSDVSLDDQSKADLFNKT